MTNVQEGWESFSRATMPSATDEVRRHVRTGFFAGALWIFSKLRDTALIEDEAALRRAFRAIDADLDLWIAECKRAAPPA